MHPGYVGEIFNVTGKSATGASVRKNIKVKARLPIEERLPVAL
jgi:hypothetical protein